MEEMASVTKQNSNNATEAAKLVDQCSAAADEGSKAVGEMSNSLQDINKSNKGIYVCKKDIADKLIKFHKMPLLSISKGDYYFRRTEKLSKALYEIRNE